MRNSSRSPTLVRNRSLSNFGSWPVPVIVGRLTSDGHRVLGVAVGLGDVEEVARQRPLQLRALARAARRTAGPRASWRARGRGCRGSRRCRCGRAARRSPAARPSVRTSSASASLVPSGASSAGRLGMPSSRSCSSASSAFCSSSAAATTVFSSRARSTSAGRSSALAPFTDWATRLVSARASSPRWIAALRPESSFSSADDVQGVAPAGQLADGVGGGVEQDAGVVHPPRVSARVERVSAAA